MTHCKYAKLGATPSLIFGKTVKIIGNSITIARLAKDNPRRAKGLVLIFTCDGADNFDDFDDFDDFDGVIDSEFVAIII